MTEHLQTTASGINMVNINKHGFVKQRFTFVLQKRCYKNFAEFKWKQLRSVTLIKNTPVQMLSCEFCKVFKNPFWQNISRRLLLEFFSFINCFLPPSELIETRFFLFLNMLYHGFRTWWISQTVLCETDDLVVACCETDFLETPGVKPCFLGWLTY